MKNTEAYHLLLRLGLVLLPMILVIALGEALLWKAGETVPVQVVAQTIRPDGPPALYLRSYIDQQTYRYRYEQIKTFRPTLVVVASSRGQWFRREMFSYDPGFYNASGAMWRASDLAELIAALPPDYAPEAVLLTVDSWLFNGNVPPAKAGMAEDIAQDDASNFGAHLHAYQKLLTDLQGQLKPSLIGKIMAGQDDGIHRYGITAWQAGGFGNDGSIQTFDRSTPTQYVDREQPPVVGRVRAGTMQFVPTEGVDPQQVATLEQALQTWSRRGTVVVGFVGPFSSEVQAAIAADPVQADYYAAFKAEAAELFRRNGWYLFVGDDLAKFGLDDRAMKDGFHGVETYNVALLLRMAEEPTVKEKLHLDPAYLERLLADPQTTAWYPVYPPSEEH
jgi:hypothetical protein